MKEIIKSKLSSRKLWVALAGIVSGIVLIVNGSTVEGTSTLIASVVGYLLAEGVIDVKAVNTVIDSVEETTKEE